ncbi:hypothetical protein MLD38_038025 [Melastoma candidum]|uniref:Uncharacterized protein n=1 Tax=Melastoma candidum TaxID=119954 RepID=A0ACB9KYK8_9MYRT|nr:hypothetical protein MLD38_038025 [Melastoma candidum]
MQPFEMVNMIRKVNNDPPIEPVIANMARVLLQMGYQIRGGLGARGQGMLFPIQIPTPADKAGIGYEEETIQDWKLRIETCGILGYPNLYEVFVPASRGTLQQEQLTDAMADLNLEEASNLDELSLKG